MGRGRGGGSETSRVQLLGPPPFRCCWGSASLRAEASPGSSLGQRWEPWGGSRGFGSGWVGASPPPSFPTSLHSPWFSARSHTRGDSRCKNTPRENYKQKMRLDSRGLPGIGGCRADTPGKGLGTAPGPWRGGVGGSPSTLAQRGAARAPSRATASTPAPGLLGKRKRREGRERRGPGLLLGSFFPWSPAWAGKASHTHGNPPSTDVTPAAGIDPQYPPETCQAHHTRHCWAEGVGGRSSGGTWSPPSSKRGLAAAGFLPGHRLPAG